MRLTHPKAQKQLLTHGVLATLRTYPYREGKKVLVKLGPSRRVAARVAKVIPNPTLGDIADFVGISGFETPEEWRLTALKLHGRKPRYLVVIELMPDAGAKAGAEGGETAGRVQARDRGRR